MPRPPDNVRVRPGIFIDRGIDELMDRAWSRSRLSVRARVERLGAKAWHVGQCGVAAGVAWFVAHTVLGHEAPMFAPIVAVVCLGMTYGQRLRRVAEVTVGVALGVAVAEVFVGVAGSGPWQVGAVVVVSMSAALVLDAGALLVTQSAVQSITVTVLTAGPSPVTRWVDAVVGGAVALVAAVVVPRAPLRKPRHQAAKVAAVIAGLLCDAAACARDGNVERAASVLAQARATDGLIRELQAAADEGLSVIASTPWSRSDAGSVRTMASIVDPLDRALRSTRVLVRRVSIAAHQGVTLPDAYVAVIEHLATGVQVVGRAWGENRSAEFGRPALMAVAEQVTRLAPGAYHTTVLLGQLRSLVVDLLELTGLSHDEAVDQVPPLPGVADEA